MYQGYIKLYRQIEEWEWYDDFLVFKLFIHLLLHANHQAKNWRGIAIQRGELITSYSQLTSQLTGKQQAKIGVQQVRTALDKLKSTGEITIKTNNKFSLIKLNNYDLYQSDNTPTNSPVTNEQQAINKQLTTNKNVKNDKNVKEIGRFTPPSLSEVEDYLTTKGYGLDAQDFLDKNEAAGWVMNGGKKVKNWQAHARSWETRRKKWAGETFNVGSLAKLLEDFRIKDKTNWVENPPKFKDYEIDKLLEKVRGIIIFGWEEDELVKKAIADKELHKFLK